MLFTYIIGKVMDIRKNDRRETVVSIITTVNGKNVKYDFVVNDSLKIEVLKHKEEFIDRVVQVYGSVSFADNRYEAYHICPIHKRGKA